MITFSKTRFSFIEIIMIGSSKGKAKMAVKPDLEFACATMDETKVNVPTMPTSARLARKMTESSSMYPLLENNPNSPSSTIAAIHSLR